MKKQAKLLFLLIVMIVGTFALANKTVFFAADATYVEGTITQDTIWTLTDSPFVVSKNVTIRPSATLTIEPGVEVRFGGYFSISVEGRLNAIGTQNKNITFTSNKAQPTAGDWGTINFTGTAQSILAYCVLKYATNGTTIENSDVEIRNSEISIGSKNGIVLINTKAKVLNSEIRDNLNSGIYSTGNNQATIQDNTIKANANGVLLTGVSTSGVNITQNKVLSNTQSGINLNATTYSNIVILYNILSANNKGFLVSGQGSTYITNNSISYNTVGIFYQKPVDYLVYWVHEARWNDIYGNQLGMDVSTNFKVTVDAEYNYWGNESGPYHAMLNPAGKGNPVGGNGESLDFIFFLTAPIGYINQRPVARLLTDKNLVPPDIIVTFIATNSSDDRNVNQYLYDFGDGTNSGWTTLSIFTHKYSSTGTYYASVTAKDDFDVVSTNAAVVTISVEVRTPFNVTLTLRHDTVASERQTPVTVYTAIGAAPVANASITLFSIKRGSFTPLYGLTNSTGYFTTSFTAPNVTQETFVRITARASKSGYADGSDCKYARVLPLLSVQVTVDPSAIKSEANSHAIVHVTCNSNPISDTAVKISSTNGSLSPETGHTDLKGDLAFNFTAPQALTQINITITATATKSGYFENEGQTNITVNPRVLVVQVTASQATMEPEATTLMTVHVTEDSSPVAGANVTLSSNLGGNFSATAGNTDSNGNFTFFFTAPKTTTQVNITISASATKSRYVDGANQTEITVNPPPGVVAGLPLTTILLIVIPIIIVAVVLVLIKMKIIVISFE